MDWSIGLSLTFGCPEIETCRGGCREEAKIIKGSYYSANPYFKRILSEKISPDIEPEEDLTIGKLSLSINTTPLDYIDNIPLFLKNNNELLSREEPALLAIIVEESSNDRTFNLNTIRIKYNLKRDLLQSFLRKLTRKQIITR